MLVDPCEHIDQAGATVGLVFLVREDAAELAEVELVQTLDVLRVDDAVVALDQQDRLGISQYLDVGDIEAGGLRQTQADDFVQYGIRE